MARDLSQAMAGLLRGVTRVRVINAGVSGGQALTGEVLGEWTGEDVVGVLGRLAVVQPAGQFHCMCLGHPAIELWVGETRRATIGVHHGRSVRALGWWSDAPLIDGEGLLRWLADRGMAGPLETFLAERAATSQAEVRQVAWVAATPTVLKPRLAALEGRGMLPRFLKPTDADAVEAVAAVRAVSGGETAVVLLGWFGGPGGPWSGYPAYEQVVEVLLRCMAVEELIAAGSEEEGVLLGLARFLARHGAAPRERRLVGAELRGRLIGLVERRGDADMQARLAAALLDGAPRTREGVRIGDAELATTLGQPVACGGAWATIDGASVVRFDAGRTSGNLVVALPEGAAELAAVGEELVVTVMPRGEVWRVPVRGGEVRVVATGQARPMSPVGFAGRAAWLEQQDLPGHRTATRVRLEGEDVLAEHAGNAWDLIGCDGALWWARHGGSLWSTLFGKNIHRADLMRWSRESGRAEVVTVLEGGDDGVSFPRLFTDGRRIGWTSGKRIGVMDGGGEPRWFTVDADITAVVPHGERVLVAVARDRVGELLVIDDGGSRVLARWWRAPWERERLAVANGQVVWNSGEHLWALALP